MHTSWKAIYFQCLDELNPEFYFIYYMSFTIVDDVHCFADCIFLYMRNANLP